MKRKIQTIITILLALFGIILLACFVSLLIVQPLNCWLTFGLAILFLAAYTLFAEPWELLSRKRGPGQAIAKLEKELCEERDAKIYWREKENDTRRELAAAERGLNLCTKEWNAEKANHEKEREKLLRMVMESHNREMARLLEYERIAKQNDESKTDNLID